MIPDPYMGRIVDPDTNKREDDFRQAVREVLGLTWDVRNAAILAELKRLKALDAPRPS